MNVKDSTRAPFRYQKFRQISLLVVLLTYIVAGCTQDHTLPDPENEYLVSASKIADVSIDEVRQRAGLPIAAVVAHGVKAYRLTYNTIGPDLKPIVASGLVLLPDNNPAKLNVLSFQHGTITTQDEAPSAYKPAGNMEAYFAGTVAASLAKSYLVVMPDYLGFGESKTIPHPYSHKATLASASLDMLRAAKEFAADEGIALNPGVRLAGYSEGGYTTLALHQAIEQTASSEFIVATSYPAAGPYDMVGTAKWVVSQNKNMPPNGIANYLWEMLTYNQLYGINAPLTALLTPTNAASVGAAILSGNPLSAIVDLNPTNLFAPSFISGILNETSPFVAAFKLNDVYDWKPKAPVVLLRTRSWFNPAWETKRYGLPLCTARPVGMLASPVSRSTALQVGFCGS